MRVLLVEDQPAHAELVSRAFERSSISLMVASTLAEAHRRIADLAPELIIADLVLTDGRGTELLVADLGIPVVILTSHGDENAAVEAIRNGALDYVVKSDVAMRDLPHVAARALRAWQLMRERAAAEVAAHERQARFESLVRHIPGAVYRCVGDTSRVEFLSEQIAEIIGIAPSGFLGDAAGDLRSLILPEDRARVDQERTAALARREPFGFEYRMLHADGSIRWVVDRGVGVFDKSGRCCWVDGVLFDMSERVRAREVETQLRQIQKLESIGRLAAGVAHDFNNLLTVILASCTLLLRRGGLDDSARRHVGDIEEAGQRSAALTRQLLAFSRRQVLAPEVVDLNRVVEDLRQLCARLLGEDVRFETNLAPNVHRVRADRGHLEQVLVNLAVNARDAMPHGGTLSIATRNESVGANHAHASGLATPAGLSPGDYAVVVVSDTGEGMSQQVLDHLFEPFFTTKAPGVGTGLGLATAHGIIMQSGGHIHVESQIGVGSRFDIYLPRCPDQGAQAGQQRAATATSRVIRQATILLIEDEPAVMKTVRTVLEAVGHTILTALDAREASRMVSEHGHRIDLIVSDIVLPDETGPALIERLRAGGFRGRVLFMSGYANREPIEDGLVRGADPFLEKPFTADVLIERVAAVLEAAAPNREHGH